MTIGAELKLIRDALRDWAAEHGGTCEVAADPLHLAGILAAKPGTPRAVVLFREETPDSDYSYLGLIIRTYWVIISKGRGFTLRLEDALMEGAGGGTAMFDLLDEARDLVISLEIENTRAEKYVDYIRMSAFDAGDLLVDAYQIEFRLRQAITT